MHSILIIRLSAIGDVVMASAVIPALRRAYPEARIDWLVEPPAREILASNPHLDEVITWPKTQWREELRRGQFGRVLRHFMGLVRHLRGRRYDLVLDLQGLLKSGIWARSTGAPIRVGLGSREGGQHLMTRVVPRRPDDPRIGSEYRQALEALGVDPGPFSMDLAVSEDAREEASAALRKNGVDGGYAIIAPFTTRPQKHWPEEFWPELTQKIQKTFGIPTVMVGGPGDKDAARQIVSAGRGELVNLVGQTGLSATLGVIQGADLMVGVDTGLTHAGIGLNRPTVALFGSTRPYLDPGVETARVLYSGLECSPCRRNPTCNGSFDCMRALTPETVMKELSLLTSTQKHPVSKSKAYGDLTQGS
jgi:heptosyltransferase-1